MSDELSPAGYWRPIVPDDTPTGSAPAAPREIPTGYTATDWPCKKCRSTHVAERCDESSDGAYEDYHFMCLDCGHSWWEESSDY